MEQLVIRPGTFADLVAVAHIQSQAPEAAGWRVEDYLAYQLDVAERAGKIVGFLVTRCLVIGESEVLNLAIHPGHRRQGIARALLASAFARSPGRWFLEVRASNEAALECYRKLGFQNVGIRPGYYRTEDGNSSEEGIVMEKGK